MGKNFFLFLLGSLLLISGITGILKNWEFVITLFKGVFGLVLAVAGLVVLSFINDDKPGSS